MHLKRNKTPKTWPITRKGTQYLIKPSHNLIRGIPLLVVLRDMLNFGKTKREVKRMLNAKKITINGKRIKEVAFSMTLYDTLSLDEKQSYRLIYSDNKKFSLKTITNSETQEKISKIINKKLIKGKKMQVSFSDGRNILTENNFKGKTGNSCLIDLKNNKIKKEIELKKGSGVVVIGGKHLGKIGKIEDENEEKRTSLVNMESTKEKINLDRKNLMAIK